MQYLSGTAKAAMQQQITAAGLKTATFTVWVDGQQVMRKAVITETGTALTEVITVSSSSINQPVNIAVPAADQTTALPAGALGGAG
jgi:type IV secretory pathway ATPase VirB11/archaellum biosynthesis ATPase